MDDRPFLYIPDADVRRLVQPARAVEIAEDALRAQAAGGVVWGEPRLFNLPLAVDGLRYLAKGCTLEGRRYAGMRAVMVNRDAPADHDGPPSKLILLCDARRGRFLAVIDEEWQHAMRTGAGVAVAARRLAPPGPQRVALIGAGWVAGPTVAALQSVVAVADVRIASRTARSREGLAARIGPPARPVAGAEEAVRGATVVVTATTSHEPVVCADWLDPGAFVYAMGDHQELTDAVYRCADRVLADDREQCVQARADIRRLIAEGVLVADHMDSLWEIVGGIRPGRTRPEERIVMRSQGLVTQDVAIAAHVYEEAVRKGVGTRLA